MMQWQPPQRSQQMPPGSQRPVQGPPPGWRPQGQGPPQGWGQRPMQGPPQQPVQQVPPVQKPVKVEPKGKKMMLRVLLALLAFTTIGFVLSVVYFYVVYIRG